MKRIYGSKILPAFLSLCMILSLFTGAAFAADAEDEAYVGEYTSVTGGDIITEAGAYEVSDATQGVITIQTEKEVTLTGGTAAAFLNGISFANHWTSDDDAEETVNTNLILQNLYIASPYSGGAMFDYAVGTVNTVTYSGTSVLETQGYKNGAIFRVAKLSDSSYTTFTLNGGTGDKLYLYKHCGSAAIGGNMNEACGVVNIVTGNLFVKGSQTGAVIGGDDQSGLINGDITVSGGLVCIVNKARGAGIGASNMGECAGNVYFTGGTTLITTDFSGSAIGRGASGTNCGTLYMKGGSLKCVITANAGTSWGTSEKDDTTSNKAITAKIVYGVDDKARAGDVAAVDLTDSGISATGDLKLTAYPGEEGKVLYDGEGLNQYKYVARTTSTIDNWQPDSSVQSLYVYLPTDSAEGEIVVEQDGATPAKYTYTYDGKEFVVVPSGKATVNFDGANAAFYVNGEEVTSVSVESGSDLEFRVVPDDGYVTQDVSAEALTDLTGGFYRISNVSGTINVTAQTASGTARKVLFQGDNQTTYIGKTPTKDAVVTDGAAVTFKPLANSGWTIVSVGVGGSTLTPDPDGSYTLENVTADTTVEITAAVQTEYTVTFSADENIKAVVDGAVVTEVTVPAGELNFTVQPLIGYQVNEVTYSGGTVPHTGDVYTLTVEHDTTVTITSVVADNSWLAYADTAWYDSSASSYDLSTAEQLAGLSKLVGEGSNFRGKTINLTNDIDLSAHDWTPIGGGGLFSGDLPEDTAHFFAGAFNGNGHKISGMSIEPASFTDGFGGFGLFGVVEGGTIADVTVSGAITFTNSVRAVGGVVGYTNGNVSGAVNHVVVTTSSSTASMTGGIVGELRGQTNEGAQISQCANLANLTGRGRFGGIVGAMAADNGSSVRVTECYNKGALTGVDSSGVAYVGGIAGYCMGEISHCYNANSISVGEGNYRVGGLVGILNGASLPYGSLTDSYACGSLSKVEGGKAVLYGAWGENDNSANVTVSNVLYPSAQEQPTMSAACSDLHAINSWTVSSAVIGDGLLSDTYFAQYGSEIPVLKRQTIEVNEGTADALNAALAQADEVRCVVVLNSAVVLDDGDAVTVAIDGRVVRGADVAGDLITVNSGATLTLNNGWLVGNANNVALNGALVKLEGGTFTMTAGRLVNNAVSGFSTGIDLQSGTLELSPESTDFYIENVVYLAEGQIISIKKQLKNIAGNITLQCASPAAELLVAEATGSAAAKNSVSKFTYNGGGYTFKNSRTEIILQ